MLAGLAPIAILISAVVAYFAIRKNAEVARKKATLDLIEKTESTPYYKDLHDTFERIRRTKSFMQIADPQTQDDIKNRRKVQAYLNQYELISIGIGREALDTETYQDWMRGPFIRDWNAAADFIQRERWEYVKQSGSWRYNPRLYENYGKVASKWSTEAIALGKKYSSPPEAPSGPGDESLPRGFRRAKLKLVSGF